MYIIIRIVISCDVTFCSLVGVTKDSEKPAVCLKIHSAGSTVFPELSAELRTGTNQKATFSLPQIYFYFRVLTRCQIRIELYFNPYPTAFPYGNGMVLHFYQQQESSTTKTVHKVINKGLKTYV